MGKYMCYNANPIKSMVGDCTVRALSKVLDQDWGQTYAELCLQGYVMCDMPSANRVWGAYLRSKGYQRSLIPDELEDYTVKDFCKDHTKGRYILAISGHVVAVVDGFYYDTWDSGDESPVYYWHQKEE